MTSVQQEPTFWRFTAASAKAALRLYFAPVYRIAAWLKEEEQPSTYELDQLSDELRLLRQSVGELTRRVYAPPDSLSGLELRVLRLKQAESIARTPAFVLAIEWAEDQLDLARRSVAAERDEVLRGVRAEVRRMEQFLEFGDPLRSSGAGAD